MDYEMDCYVMYEWFEYDNHDVYGEDCWRAVDITFDQTKAENWVSQNKDNRYYLKKSVEVW